MSVSIATSLPLFKKVISNKVFKNFSYLSIGTLCAQLLSLVTILKVTRILAPGEYGLFSFMTAQGLLLVTVSSLGMGIIFVRSIARDPSRAMDMVFNGFLLRVATLATLTLLYVVYNFHFGSLSTGQILLVFSLTLVNSLYDLTENVFHGNQKMLPPSVISISYSLLWFIIVYALPSYASNANSVFLIYILLNALKAGISFSLLRSHCLLIGQTNKFWISAKQFITESWPYFVMILVMLPISSLANNFLDLNSNLNEVGYYNLSQRLIGPVALVLSIVFTVIFPKLSALWIENEQQCKQLISVGFKYFMLITLVICFLFTLFAEEIVLLLFPPKYIPIIAVSKVQVWYLFLSLVNSLIGTILGAINQEKLVLHFAIVCSLFCTPVFFYASKFGALGLSYGYVIAFAVCMIYVWYTFQKRIKIKVQHGNLIWLLAIILYFISYFFPPETSLGYKVGLAFPVVAFAIFYCARTYTLKTLSSAVI